jgi:hypothetical protein
MTLDNIKTILFYLCIAILVVFLCYGISALNNRMNPTRTKTDTLTVVNTKVDTIIQTKVKPSTQVKYRIVRDTTLKYDTVTKSVEVPITQYTYKDSSYHISLTGYRVILDTVQTFQRTKTITNTITVTKYINRKPWFISPTIGVGYGMFNKKPDVFIGISLGKVL